MGYLKALRPDIKKIGWSILLIPVWFFLGILFRTRSVCDCGVGGFEGCIDYQLFFPILPRGCHCSCISLGQSLFTLLILLLPSLILYLVIAYIQYRKNKD